MSQLEAESTEPGTETRGELASCLRPMIDELPEQYRDALILSELEGKTQQEVSVIQDISLSGAKSRIQRGRGMLKALMLQCCKIEFDKSGRPIDYSKKEPHCDSC